MQNISNIFCRFVKQNRKAMSNFKSMVFKLDPNNREAEGQLVERYLTALGYRDRVEWNKDRRHDNTRQYISADGVEFRFMYMNDNCERETFETIPTPYQVAVAEHMATAPQELAEYVRGRLVSSDTWVENDKPIRHCDFPWYGSVERGIFWEYIDIKNWPKAMATYFWKGYTAPTQAPTERPKGVIGQWYTLTSDFDGDDFSENREAGYTWQCQDVCTDDEPMIDGVGIGHDESYRLATPEEISAAQVAQSELEGFEAVRRGGDASQKEVHGLLNFEKPEEYDYVNPAHYKELGIEVIDMMAAIWGKEATATHCEMCAFKYRLRIGSKPNQSIEDELGKINWYMEKAKELRNA